jgi:RND family efflux transporter MFP subunit
MKRTVAIAACVALLAFLAWRGIGAVRKPQETAKAPAARPPVPVEVAEVRRGPIREEQRLSGEVIPTFRFIVASRVPGRLLEITKKVGDRVAAGEVLARVDDEEYRQTVLEAEADLGTARASLAEATVQLEQAERDLARLQTLEARQLISRSEVERARASRDALVSRQNLARAQIEQREAARSSARIRLGYAALTASRAGVVAERFADEGSLLAANTPILAVIGVNPALVRATLTERLAARVAVGLAVALEADALPGLRFPGRVARIAPALNEETRTAEMEVEADNAALQLRPGMFVRVGVVLAERPDAQLVPTAALVTRDGGHGVFVVDAQGRSVAWVPVTPGIATPALTEVAAPQLSGRVVTLGQHLLQHGSAITLPGGGKPAETGGG